VKSRNNDQLAGTFKEKSELSDCDPIITVGDLWPTQRKNLNGVEFTDLELPAIPCGLVAKSIFNDTYELYDPSSQNVTIDDTDIAWSSDREFKFANIKADDKDHKEIQWLDMTDQHFIVWMRTAGLPNFRKLYGRIDKDLEKGEYVMKIDN